MANPLLHDRDVTFLLYEVLEAESLCKLPYFADHSRETFDLYLGSCRKVAREALFPAYRPMDEAPPRLVDGQVLVHPCMKDLYAKLVELGVSAATRSPEVGGQALPTLVSVFASGYLSAANLGAYGYLGLTAGAARLIESYGSEQLKQRYMTRMYGGEWCGTMALTEPQAGSSLSDVQTRARPQPDGGYRMQGAKIFISGGDQDVTENIVHMTLARLDGAPAGVKGISLFLVPKLRDEDGRLVPNDVATSGLIHKIGWRGLPSVALSFGENDDCHGYLVGEPNQGLKYMFQMMNEARLGVGLQSAATAYVAYREAIEYATTRPQGRRLTNKNPETPQVPIVEHTDVRRMLLRQKAIAEGALHLIGHAARYADWAEHAEDPTQRRESALLLDLLTPVAKSFPAEKGFEANALSVQIHGGYGYSSEYLPESWLRDQKLNSIHEGTTGIQSMDLLGRKVMLGEGAALKLLGREITRSVMAAREAGVTDALVGAVEKAMQTVAGVTLHLAGSARDPEAFLLHSVDYLDMFSTLVISWMWLMQATAAEKGLRDGAASDADFYRGKLCAAQYFIRTELPRIDHLAQLCKSGEDSYARLRPEWL